LSASFLEELENAAVRLVESVGYVGVGTVEFLVAGDAFYFLEVNPRLQVEHGITEEIAGVDLVELQIRIARGEPLPEFPPAPGGVAIEARVCAEDPAADFLPAPGRIAVCEPALGPNLRLDSGYTAGGAVPSEFDSLIAKVIARGSTRDEARARLACALTDFELVVCGGATNKGYLVDLLQTETYRSGAFDTEWLDANPDLRVGTDRYAVEALVATSILYYQRARDAARRAFFEDPTNLTPAVIPPSTGQRIDLGYAGANYPLAVFATGAWRYRVHLDGRVTTVRLRSRGPHSADLEIEGRTLRVLHDISEHGARVEIEAHPFRFESELAGQVRAGTPALVIALDVAVGDRVEPGQRLGLLEAMKLEIGFHASVGGVVKEIAVRGGQQVATGDLLLVIETAETDPVESAAKRLELPSSHDELDVFFGTPPAAEDPVVSLLDADRAEPATRRQAIDVARREIRRVVMGYDVNPERVEKLAAVIESPLPDGLTESFRWELAEIRHELTLFADVEQLFSRVPRPSASGEAEPSNYAQLRRYVQRLPEGGEGAGEEFRQLLETALTHYEATGLRYGDGLERAVLRLLASQHAPELRRRLAIASLRRVTALAASGIHLGDDSRLADALARIAGLRGLLPDRLADLAIEASYAIFQGPGIEREAERTSKDVEAWLAAAESRVSHPPSAVLAHLANAPLPVFQRVGRWLSDADPRRRAVAIAAHIRRCYATSVPASQTSGEIGGIPVERIDWLDGRIVVGSVALAAALEPTLDHLLRAARAAAASASQSRSAPPGGVHAIELLIPRENGCDVDALARQVAALLPDDLPVHRLNLSLVGADGQAHHLCFARCASGEAERVETHGLHPETAHRIGIERLAAFDLERIEAAPDIYCFHLSGREVRGDERIFVLADVRGHSPDASAEMILHLPAFERAFHDATRTLRNTLGVRDPRRRLHWNRVALFVTPPIILDSEAVDRLTRRLYPATRHLGLEKVIVRLNVIDRDRPQHPPRAAEIVIADLTGSRMEISWRDPHRDPLEPARDYERKVVEARRRRLVYPYEILRMLEGGTGRSSAAVGDAGNRIPPGGFEEYDLDPRDPQRGIACVAGRAYGKNTAAVVFGIITTPTPAYPEGIRRVLILSDPTMGMGSLAAPECDRIVAAIDLAETEQLPVEWVPVSSGARIAMDSGTENLDATARVVRRIVTFTQRGGVIHVIVQGVNVGAQSYFDALATMLQHTRGVLIMTPGASMVLTGRAALEASGSVAAEDEAAIGGFERVMGPNGEAQYFAHNLVEAYQLMYEHYRFTYVAPGESGPRPQPTTDPMERDITRLPYRSDNGHGFDSIGDLFRADSNPERKRPFAMRQLMAALIDQDGGHLERWRRWEGAETAIVWDTQLGGRAVCLIGIESQNLARSADRASDGPAAWTGGTLFPLSSKKVARALNACSGNRPAVILANLSGFDGSPESMRRLQLEYGAEIARAVVNFRGPLLFLVVSRYHGGAYVVFSSALNDELHSAALEGSFASVIGGGPAAAVVFNREVRARTAADARIRRLRRITGGRASAEEREEFERIWREVLLEKQAEIAAEFDRVHSVERARAVGSIEALVAPARMRAHLIETLDRKPTRRADS